MVDGRGYPYFVDFRFSKSFIDEGENAPSARTFTLCGTPEYVVCCCRHACFVTCVFVAARIDERVFCSQVHVAGTG